MFIIDNDTRRKMVINDLFNAITLVLCNYFSIAWGKKIVALDKNSCIKQISNTYFF
jgi:hypothetical protein